MKAIVLQPVKIKGKRVAPGGSPITVDAKLGAEMIAAGVLAEATPEALAALEQLQQLDAGEGTGEGGEAGVAGDAGEGGAGGEPGPAGGGEPGAAGTEGAAQ